MSREAARGFGLVHALSVAAIAAAVLGAFLTLGRVDWGRQQRLRNAGMPADGWVTAKNFKDKRRIAYAFRVAEKTFTGVGVGGYGNPEFSDLAIGDRVLVVYLPADPAVSTMGDPYEHLRSQNQALLLILVLGGAAVAYLVRREQRRWR